jgi:protease PrsW
VNATDFATTLRALAFVVAGSLFWLQYFDLKDALQPEPRRRLLQAFGLGMLAVGVAWAGYAAVAAAGLPSSPPEGSGDVVLYFLLVVGPVEEGAKFLVARAVCFRWKEFDERIDGLIYAAAVALGFAAIENMLFLRAVPWTTGLVRALVSPLTHSLFAAVWGFGTSHALLATRTPASRFLWQALPLVAAMVLHGAYDVAVLLDGAAPLAAVLVTLLWAFVIWNARRVVKRAVAG